VRLLAHDKGRMVRSWYWVDGRFTADGRLAKLLQLKAALTGSSRAMAIVAVAADYRETPDESQATLDQFVADLGPLGPWLASVAP